MDPAGGGRILAHEFELVSQIADGWHWSAVHQGWKVNPLFQGRYGPMDEKPTAVLNVRTVVATLAIPPRRACKVFSFWAGIMIYRNTSIYTKMTEDEHRLGRNMQVHLRFILLTLSQNVPKYMHRHPHPSLSYEA